MAGSEHDATSDEEAGPIRLLLVEDDPEDVSSIKRLLAETQDTLLMAGHAPGLEEALLKLQHGSYDVVLLDLSLPEGLGLDASRAPGSRPRRFPSSR